MNDIAQVNFREADQVDWENYGKSSTYQTPPPALDVNGKPIIYYGVVGSFTQRANQYEVDAAGEPYLNYVLDDIKIVKSGAADGYVIRFTEASVRPFTTIVNGERVNMKGNPNKLGNYLRACGLSAKPQSNAEYIAAVNATKGRAFPFILDWKAKSKDTGETVKGFLAFPLSEDGLTRKAILKMGDTVSEVDRKGNITGTKVVGSEVLFANAVVKFFQDPARGTK